MLIERGRMRQEHPEPECRMRFKQKINKAKAKAKAQRGLCVCHVDVALIMLFNVAMGKISVCTTFHVSVVHASSGVAGGSWSFRRLAAGVVVVEVEASCIMEMPRA